MPRPYRSQREQASLEIIEQPRERQENQGRPSMDHPPIEVGQDGAPSLLQGPAILAGGNGAGSTLPSRPVSGRLVDHSAALLHARVKPRWVEVCFAITFIVYVVLIPQLL